MSNDKTARCATHANSWYSGSRKLTSFNVPI